MVGRLKLQKKIADHRKAEQEQERKFPWRSTRDGAVISIIFEALETEHPYL